MFDLYSKQKGCPFFQNKDILLKIYVQYTFFYAF